MRIALAQVHNSPDVSANRANAERLIAQAAKAGAELILFPEMSILEFFPRVPHRYEYFDLAEPAGGPSMEWFAAQARHHGLGLVYNHYELSPEHLCYDTSFVVDRQGKCLGSQRMMHLAEEPGYNEKFYYAPGAGGYNVFEIGGWRFGIAICYDRHFPEVFRALILQGAELVLVPTAVAAAEPFAEVYELEMRAAAVTHGVYIAVANRAGLEDPLSFLGRSMIVDPLGGIVDSLGPDPNRVLVADLEKRTITKARQLFPFLRDRRPETYS
jgi:N-carbamoylputrescine amidase